MFKRIAILAAGLLVPAGIALGVGAPSALAANPQTVNVSVASQITITGLQNITFNGVSNNGVGVIGCPSGGCTNGAFGQTTEAFTVNSNAAPGFNLQEAAGLSFFQGPSPATTNVIPDADWNIQGEDTTAGGSTAYNFSPTVAGKQLMSTLSGPSTDLFNETWTMTIPTTAPALAAGTYNNTLVYTALSN